MSDAIRRQLTALCAAAKVTVFFPSGSHAFSWGLGALVHDTAVTDAAEFESFIGGRSYGAGPAGIRLGLIGSDAAQRAPTTLQPLLARFSEEALPALDQMQSFAPEEHCRNASPRPGSSGYSPIDPREPAVTAFVLGARPSVHNGGIPRLGLPTSCTNASVPPDRASQALR
jgi:hypothetical protein